MKKLTLGKTEEYQRLLMLNRQVWEIETFPENGRWVGCQ